MIAMPVEINGFKAGLVLDTGASHSALTARVAETLGISPRTVEVHKARVMEKLQVENVVELVRIVVNPPGPG